MKCKECVYHEEIPGSAHIKCNHPEFKKLHENPLVQLLSVFGRRAGVNVILPSTFEVELDQHGVERGWCNFPFNFDPVWVISCSAFKPK